MDQRPGFVKRPQVCRDPDGAPQTAPPNGTPLNCTTLACALDGAVTAPRQHRHRVASAARALRTDGATLTRGGGSGTALTMVFELPILPSFQDGRSGDLEAEAERTLEPSLILARLPAPDVEGLRRLLAPRPELQLLDSGLDTGLLVISAMKSRSEVLTVETTPRPLRGDAAQTWLGLQALHSAKDDDRRLVAGHRAHVSLAGRAIPPAIAPWFNSARLMTLVAGCARGSPRSCCAGRMAMA